jgi:hypothetical protein
VIANAALSSRTPPPVAAPDQASEGPDDRVARPELDARLAKGKQHARQRADRTLARTVVAMGL